ncbi:MAG: hypothetical protein H6962_04190 [Chromatiaceae bacterium]|nr:hypothetical protein [Chromatiaceae bacterium]
MPRAHLDFGVQNKYGEVRIGAFAGQLHAEEDFGLFPFVPDFDLNQVGYNVQITFDQIDSPSFGRNGVLAQFSSFGTVEEWGSEDDYNKTELFLLGAKSVGDHAIQLAGYLGDSLYGDLPNYDPLLLGGFLRGSGYRMDELLGNNVAMARAVYSYKVAALPPPLGRGVYVGASLEATQASLGIDLKSDKEIRPSASVFVGADTFLGPAYLAFGHAFSDDNPNAVYILLGTP